MRRAVSGNRHEINYQFLTAGGKTFVQATCICDNFDPPARFARNQAEEDGHDHLVRHAQQGQGRPLKKEKP
jgi:hypothetical protein